MKTMGALSREARELLEDGLMGVSEAAKWFGVSRSTLYNMMGRGQVPFVRLGGKRLIPRRSLVNLAAEHLVVRDAS